MSDHAQFPVRINKAADGLIVSVDRAGARQIVALAGLIAYDEAGNAIMPTAPVDAVADASLSLRDILFDAREKCAMAEKERDAARAELAAWQKHVADAMSRARKAEDELAGLKGRPQLRIEKKDHGDFWLIGENFAINLGNERGPIVTKALYRAAGVSCE